MSGTGGEQGRGKAEDFLHSGMTAGALLNASLSA
jgi:hypothetical protein